MKPDSPFYQNTLKTLKQSEMFDGLEETVILHYQVDISDKDKGMPMAYYAPGEFSYVADPGVIYHLEGWWKIRA